MVVEPKSKSLNQNILFFWESLESIVTRSCISLCSKLARDRLLGAAGAGVPVARHVRDRRAVEEAARLEGEADVLRRHDRVVLSAHLLRYW